MKHFNKIYRGVLALEADVANGQVHVEKERVIYARLAGFDEIREKATSCDHHEQWMIKIEPTEDNAKAKGQVRVRKLVPRTSRGEVKEGAEVQYVLTCKSTFGQGQNLEVPAPSSEDAFKVFKRMASNGMIKDRYHFPVGSTGLVFEVDAYLKPDGSYHEWVKIDYETNDMSAELPQLPFVVEETILDKTSSRSDQARIWKMYDDCFLTKNTGDHGTVATEAIDGMAVFGAGILAYGAGVYLYERYKAWKESKKAADKPTQTEISLYQWISKNYNKGKLSANLKPHGGNTTVTKTNARVFFRGKTPFSTVPELLVEINKDLAVYRKIFNQYKAPIKKHADLTRNISSDLRDMQKAVENSKDGEGMYKEVTMKDVAEVLVKYKGKAGPSLSKGFSEPSEVLLGNYSDKFVSKGYDVVGFQPYKQKTTDRGEVSFENVSQAQIDAILKTIAAVSKLESEAEEIIDGAYGLDGTDPPLRAFVGQGDDETDWTEEHNQIIDPFCEPLVYSDYTGLASIISKRAWCLEEGLWNLIRAATKHDDGGDHEYR